MWWYIYVIKQAVKMKNSIEHPFSLVKRQFHKKKWIEINYFFKPVLYTKTLTEAKKFIKQNYGIN